MDMIHVSLVLNVHDETLFLRRTLRSCEEAAQYANAVGLNIELVVVLDRSPQATQDWVTKYRSDAFVSIHVLNVEHGSLGLSRNDGVRHSNGIYVMICDADDLMSFNSITVMMDTIKNNRKLIVFPEYVVEFGAKHNIIKYYDLAIITPFMFLDCHPYLSRIFVHRDIFKTIAYEDSRLSDGYAYEDWHFNCDALADGYDFIVAPQTVLFYRKRGNSLLSESNRQSVQQIRPSRLFVPSVYQSVCSKYRQELYAFGADLPERPLLPQDASKDAAPFLGSATLRELLHKANRIDPAVDILRYHPKGYWSPASDETFRGGIVYHEVCSKLGDKAYTDIFLLPFLVPGGAEKYLIQIMEGLCRTQADGPRILVICGQPNPKVDWLERLPPGTVFIDLWDLGTKISDDLVDIVTLKIIQAVGGNARIHIKSCEFSHRLFRKYKTVFKENKIIYYRFCDDRYIYDGRFYSAGSGCDFISDCLPAIDLFICDHRKIVEIDRDRFGINFDKWTCLLARCEVTTTSDAAAMNRSVRHNRLLWASRIDWQKRPDLLLLIGAELQRRNVPITIEIYGRSVLSGINPSQFDSCPRLQYQGPFNDFGSLDSSRYDGFVYTSMFDGLPNVVLEAMAAGLPVIAPDCDGLPEVVRSGDTGFLVPNVADIQELVRTYCNMIERLCGDTDLRVEMSRKCVSVIEMEHSSAAHSVRLAGIMDKLHGR